MQTFYINIGSVTYAHKAVSVLTRKGYKCRIGRSLKNSCSFGVYVESESRERVEAVLRESGVPLNGNIR